MSLRWFLLLQSGLAVAMGIARASFQSVVDPAQALAGVVNYDPGEAFAQYLNSNVNLQTIFAAAMLKVGCSELAVSVVFSCLGTLFYILSISLIVYALTESKLLAFTLSHFLFATAWGLLGHNYEIVLLPGQVTFAPLAIAYLALALGVVLYGNLVAGSTMVGLGILVHPFLGAYCSGALLLSLLICVRKLKPIVALGASALLSALVIYICSKPNPSESSLAVDLIKTNLSKHRVPVTMESLAPFVCIFLACLALVPFARKRRTAYPTIVLTLGFMLAAAGLLSFVYTLDSSEFSSLERMIYASIPSRNANLVALVGIPVILAMALMIARSYVALALLPLLIYWAESVRAMSSVPRLLEGSLFSVSGFDHLWYAVAACLVVFLRFLPKRLLPAKLGPVLTGAISFGVLALVAWQNFLFASQFSIRNSYFGNDPALEKASEGSGKLLAAGIDGIARQFPQARVRRPLIFDVQLPSTLPYISIDPKKILESTKTIYGLDLAGQDRLGRINQPCDDLACPQIQGLFSARTRQQWVELASQFGFKQVLVPSHWQLDLPLIAESRIWRLYSAHD